jgi:hypothetical protein
VYPAEAVPAVQISKPRPPLAAESEKTCPWEEGSDIDSASNPVLDGGGGGGAAEVKLTLSTLRLRSHFLLE